jgi:hypothetical protein
MGRLESAVDGIPYFYLHQYDLFVRPAEDGDASFAGAVTGVR